MKEQSLDFYIERPKNILIMFLFFIFVVFGSVLIVAGVRAKDLFVLGFGLFIATPFIVLLFKFSKVFLSPEPYLRLTEEGLIIHNSSEHAILILWEDISGYRIRHINFNQFVEVIFDQDKYLPSMSRKSKKFYQVKEKQGSSLFAFGLGHIKRKDRDKLISELDRSAGTSPLLTNQIYHPKKLHGEKQKLSDRVNKKYFFGAYGYSLIFAILALFFFFLTQGDIGYFILIIIQFILFPFAKLVYDLLIGFRVNDYIDKQEHAITVSIERLLFIVHLVVYIFTLFIAPFGILYLIILSLVRVINKRRS